MSCDSPRRGSIRIWLIVTVTLLSVIAGVFLVTKPWQRYLYTRTPAQADVLIREADQKIAVGEFEEAIKLLRKCLEFRPANARLHFLLARTSRRADDARNWQTHLITAESLQWDKEQILLERELMVVQSGKPGAEEEALYERLKNDSLDDELILEAMVKGFIEAKRPNEALTWSEAWVRNHPGNWAAYLARGNAYYLRLNMGLAALDYRRAIELNPGHRKGRLSLASSLMINGQFPEVLPLFQQYTQDYPQDTAGLLGLGNTQLELNRLSEAQATLDRLLALQPKNAAALLLRGRVELTRDQPALALSWMQKAENVAPFEADIVNSLLTIYRQLGRKEDENRLAKRGHEINAIDTRIRVIKVEVSGKPTNIELRLEAASLYMKIQQESQALDWLLGALVIDNNHKSTHIALAECFERMGEVGRAEFHRERAK